MDIIKATHFTVEQQASAMYRLDLLRFADYITTVEGRLDKNFLDELSSKLRQLTESGNLLPEENYQLLIELSTLALLGAAKIRSQL